MGSQQQLLGVALAGLLLASCAGQSMDDQANAPPADVLAEPAAEAQSADSIVVTGQVAIGKARRENRAMTAPPPMIAPYAPPPPPAMDASMWPPAYKDVGRDKFDKFVENSFRIVREAPVSTFSIDVDTASYSWVRASLNQNVLPQPAAVRTEEMINYFHYDYAPPATTAQPFGTSVAVFPSPWAVGRKLVRIGIKGYEVERATRPRANLVFLIDTSGSMNSPDKLPLVQKSLTMLLDELDARDTVAIVTYAGSAVPALPA